MRKLNIFLSVTTALFLGAAMASPVTAAPIDDGGKTTMKKTIIAKRAVAGSRKVGLVGERPYPAIKGLIPRQSGGDYFTEDIDTYFSNPAVNVRVHDVGQFNN